MFWIMFLVELGNDLAASIAASGYFQKPYPQHSATSSRMALFV